MLIISLITLFMVNSSHLNYNKIQHVCEAISGYFVVLVGVRSSPVF